jgi:hypothetical protein
LKLLRHAMLILALAWCVALGLLTPTVLGLAIDKHFDTFPWAFIAGSVAGVFLATFGVTRLVLGRMRRLEPPPIEQEPQ